MYFKVPKRVVKVVAKRTLIRTRYGVGVSLPAREVNRYVPEQLARTTYLLHRYVDLDNHPQ